MKGFTRYPGALLAAVLVSSALLSGSAHATLFDRGGGLIYDDVFNITWLQDANYARTSGYDADGKMNWSQAKDWVGNLSYHDSVRNVDYADWRLPTIHPLPTHCDYSASGGTCGVNVTPVGSEFAHLFYVDFDNISPYDANGDYLPYGIPWGLQEDPANTNDESIFINIPFNLGTNGTAYWMDGSYGTSSFAWFFDLGNGYQGVTYKTFDYLVPWAVRDGDVAAVSAEVPEPSTLALSALLLAVLVRSRKRTRRD